MENLINQMENNNIHCGETEYDNFNKLHKPLLDNEVSIENLDNLFDLYKNYLVAINFDDEREDIKKIYNLINKYILKYNTNDFENCVKIAVEIYDNILTFLNVYEE